MLLLLCGPVDGTPLEHSLWRSRSGRIVLFGGLIIAVACAVWIWASWPHVDHERVYRIGYGNDAPLHFQGLDGRPTGLAVDLVQEAARRARVRLAWSHESGFNQTKMDLWVLHAITPERQKVVHLTEAYLQSESCFIVMKESPTRTARDLRSARISVISSKVQRTALGQLFPGATLLPTGGNVEALEALTSGKVDAVFLNQYAVLSALLSGGPRPGLRILPAGVAKLQLALASTRSQAAVADVLRGALQDMAADGAVEPIMERWAFFPNPTMDVIGELSAAKKRIQFLVLGATGLAVLLVVAIWLGGLARRRASQLAEAENLLRQVADRVPGMVCQFQMSADGKWSFPYASDAIRQIFRLSPADVRTDAAKIGAAIHPEDVAATAASIRVSAQKLEHWVHEYRVKFPDGTVRWLQGNALPQREPDGATLWHGFITDITERKAADAAVEVFERKIQETQKLESLGVLAGGIAHDFNNILTGILGNASLAGFELPAGAPAQAYLESIRLGSQRAADLCLQMLAYSGKGRFVVKRISLNALIEETTQLLQISISKQAVLRFNLHANLPAIEVDVTQIRQVIMNLVINSSEAISTKSGMINVSTGMTRVDCSYLGGTILEPELTPGTYVYLEVSDNGCGMSAETKSKIFDPFFTTKFTGRGLGLAAVLGIVRGHRGALKVYSEVGRGTTFKLLFPCADGDVDVVTASVISAPTWRAQGTILVVDDEASVRSTAALMLKKLGFDVTLAADGLAAVQIFAANPAGYVLVLMDLTMPHLDGRDAYSEMRRVRDDVRVVMMSGFNEQEVVSQFAGKGVIGFLQKPFLFEALQEAVRRALSM
jgi:PAS domain S-box-containing protein